MRYDTAIETKEVMRGASNFAVGSATSQTNRTIPQKEGRDEC